MRLLLDTSAVIGWLERRDSSVVDLIANADSAPAISLVTLGELHRGVLRSPDDDTRRVRELHADFVATHLDVAIPDAETAAVWAELAHRLPRGVGHNDLWIAACAARTGRTLVTQDTELAAHLDRLAPVDTAHQPEVLLCRR